MADIDVNKLLKLPQPKEIHKELLSLKRIGKPSSEALTRLASQAAASMAQSAAVASWLSSVISAANLAATVVSTVVINRKLDAISEKIDALHKYCAEQKELDFQHYITDEFRRVDMDHAEFAGNVQKNIPIDDEKLIDTIKRCYASIVSAMEKTDIYPVELILSVVYEILPVYTDLIILYYRQFYDAAYGEYTLHERWLEVYDLLTDSWFMDKGFVCFGWKNAFST